MCKKITKIVSISAMFLIIIGIGFDFSSYAAIPVVTDVAKDPREVPSSPIGDVSVNLDAVEVVAEIAPGKNAWVWTFANQGGKPTVPGPMIRVREGNHVTINLCNKLDNIEPHNIDFHASMGPGGGAAVTNIEPGQCKTLKFKALRQGAYIYHCAGEGMPWEHVSYGMYGLIQVDPPGGLSPGFKEFYIGQSDWYLIKNSASEEPKIFLDPDVLVLDEEKADAEHPNMFSFNGHMSALTAPALFGNAITVNQGDKVRFFFVTGGPNIGSNWHIIGTIFDKVYTGHNGDAVRNEETVYVAPGSAAVFELAAPVPGRFLLVDHALWRVPKGAAGFMHVEGRPSPTCDSSGNVLDPGSWPFDIFSPATCTSGH
jgi:nitrite reductase (NO-forming)